MALLDRFIASTIGLVPRPLVWRVARRYVAGASADAGMEVARSLQEEGCCATFDILGEFVTRVEEGDERAEAYLDVLRRIRREGLDANISVKLTSFGLHLDEETAYRRLRHVVDTAHGLGNFVRIDMEDSSCTDATLRCYRRLREEGRDNVGVVLQAYMRRTLDDIEALAPLRPNYRLCKGIYVEPPEVAYKGFQEIRDNFVAALERMLDLGSYVGIATHDEALVAAGREAVDRRGLGLGAYEFQMLLGVTPGLRRTLVEAGHRLRVYVPFGADWYAYCVRRLKENPRIGRHVVQALFRRS